MNVKRLLSVLFVGLFLQNVIVAMDYNIVDAQVYSDKPTSFLGIMAIARKKQILKDQKEMFEKNGHILSRSFSVDSFDRALHKQPTFPSKEIIRRNKVLKWKKNYDFNKNSSQSFFLDVAALGFREPLISPTSVDRGIISPSTKVKGILKNSSGKK